MVSAQTGNKLNLPDRHSYSQLANLLQNIDLWVLVLTCIHNLCFEQKLAAENFQGLKLKKQGLKLIKSLFIAWACFHNADLMRPK